MQMNPDKPRVMIVIATDIIGGPGKGLFQFLKFADHRRFDYVLCNYDRVGLKGFRNDFLEMARSREIPVHRFYQRATIDPFLVLQALNVIKTHRINIVQTHSYKSNILGCLLKRLFNMRWIAFAHGYTGENKKIALYNRLDLWSYKFADLAVVVSEPLKRLLQANGAHPRRIVKLPNAVDRDELKSTGHSHRLRQSLHLGETDKIVAVIGRLSPEKGQGVFLEAFQAVRARCKGLKALIIGDGQERERLERYCREHDLIQDVRFTGHVTHMGDYYRIVDLLVIPSFSEGLPNVLLEGMALGIPVISTRVGAVGEVLQGMPLNMVAAGDSRALAERMIRFLSEPTLIRQTAAQGKGIIAGRYDPRARAERLVGLYDRVLQTRSVT